MHPSKIDLDKTVKDVLSEVSRIYCPLTPVEGDFRFIAVPAIPLGYLLGHQVLVHSLSWPEGRHEGVGAARVIVSVTA